MGQEVPAVPSQWLAFGASRRSSTSTSTEGVQYIIPFPLCSNSWQIPLYLIHNYKSLAPNVISLISYYMFTACIRHYTWLPHVNASQQFEPVQDVRSI